MEHWQSKKAVFKNSGSILEVQPGVGWTNKLSNKFLLVWSLCISQIIILFHVIYVWSFYNMEKKECLWTIQSWRCRIWLLWPIRFSYPLYKVDCILGLTFLYPLNQKMNTLPVAIPPPTPNFEWTFFDNWSERNLSNTFVLKFESVKILKGMWLGEEFFNI